MSRKRWPVCMHYALLIGVAMWPTKRHYLWCLCAIFINLKHSKASFFAKFNGAYESLRFLDLEMWWFLCSWRWHNQLLYFIREVSSILIVSRLSDVHYWFAQIQSSFQTAVCPQSANKIVSCPAPFMYVGGTGYETTDKTAHYEESICREEFLLGL